MSINADGLEPAIGLEIHIELMTNTKIFCSCRTDFGDEQNTHICPTCMALPGALPVFNAKVLEYALKVGYALNCEINPQPRFDRKNYFYADNPQNYQISQLYAPLCRNGCLSLAVGNEPADYISRVVRIHELHMEEDAGKLIHDDTTKETIVDYNRAGVPLIEIVTEPDFRTADEVIAFLEKLQIICRYLRVSDCKIQEGSMRVDVNLSMRQNKDYDKLFFLHRMGEISDSSMNKILNDKLSVVNSWDGYGIRTEMKNLSSFHAIREAIEAEMSRQTELLLRGKKPKQETRRWDENEKKSYSMRTKEEATDYRYMPEPDLMPLQLDDEYLENIRMYIPELREEKIQRFIKEYRLPVYDILLLTEDKDIAELFEDAAALCLNPKKVSNFIMGEMLRLMKERNVSARKAQIKPRELASLICMVEGRVISMSTAKEVFEAMFDTGTDPEEYVELHGLKLESDSSLIENTIDSVIENNPEAVCDYRAGKVKAVGFLVGQAMKALKGKADANVLRETIVKKLASE